MENFNPNSVSPQWVADVEERYKKANEEPKEQHMKEVRALPLHDIVRQFRENINRPELLNRRSSQLPTEPTLADKVQFLSKDKLEHYKGPIGRIKQLYSSFRNLISMGTFTSSGQLGVKLAAQYTQQQVQARVAAEQLEREHRERIRRDPYLPKRENWTGWDLPSSPYYDLYPAELKEEIRQKWSTIAEIHERQEREKQVDPFANLSSVAPPEPEILPTTIITSIRKEEETNPSIERQAVEAPVEETEDKGLPTTSVVNEDGGLPTAVENTKDNILPTSVEEKKEDLEEPEKDDQWEVSSTTSDITEYFSFDDEPDNEKAPEGYDKKDLESQYQTYSESEDSSSVYYSAGEGYDDLQEDFKEPEETHSASTLKEKKEHQMEVVSEEREEGPGVSEVIQPSQEEQYSEDEKDSNLSESQNESSTLSQPLGEEPSKVEEKTPIVEQIPIKSSKLAKLTGAPEEISKKEIATQQEHSKEWDEMMATVTGQNTFPHATNAEREWIKRLWQALMKDAPVKGWKSTKNSKNPKEYVLTLNHELSGANPDIPGSVTMQKEFKVVFGEELDKSTKTYKQIVSFPKVGGMLSSTGIYHTLASIHQISLQENRTTGQVECKVKAGVFNKELSVQEAEDLWNGVTWNKVS